MSVRQHPIKALEAHQCQQAVALGRQLCGTPPFQSPLLAAPAGRGWPEAGGKHRAFKQGSGHSMLTGGSSGAQQTNMALKESGQQKSHSARSAQPHAHAPTGGRPAPQCPVGWASRPSCLALVPHSPSCAAKQATPPALVWLGYSRASRSRALAFRASWSRRVNAMNCCARTALRGGTGRGRASWDWHTGGLRCGEPRWAADG